MPNYTTTTDPMIGTGTVQQDGPEVDVLEAAAAAMAPAPKPDSKKDESPPVAGKDEKPAEVKPVEKKDEPADDPHRKPTDAEKGEHHELRKTRRQITERLEELRAIEGRLGDIEQRHTQEISLAREIQKAAAEDPEQLLNILAKRSGKSAQEIYRGWTASLAGANGHAPVGGQLEEKLTTMAARLEAFEKSEQQRSQQQTIDRAKGEIAEIVRAGDKELPLLDGYQPAEVAEAAYGLMASTYERTGKRLDLDRALRQIHAKLEDDERRFQQAREKRAGHTTGSPGSQTRTASPPSTSLPNSTGPAAPKPVQDMGDDEFERHLASLVG